MEEGCQIGLVAPFQYWSNGDAVSYTNWYPPHFSNGQPGQEETWLYSSRRGITGAEGMWDDFGGGSMAYVCRLPGSGDSTGALGSVQYP